MSDDLIVGKTEFVPTSWPAFAQRAIGVDPIPLPQATKHDTGKDEWHLLPNDALRAAAKVFTYGAGKYGAHNYQKGADWSRYYSAALRHLTAWWDRDPADPESGFSHLAHAVCCGLILTVFELRGIGRDDRPDAAPPTGG